MHPASSCKIVATIEARMSSSRLPGKVLMDLSGKPVLQHIVERLKRSRYIDEVVVATTDRPGDDPVETLCRSIGCGCFRGSEDDVLLRVLEAARSADAGLIVEITGDCPCIDWRHVDAAVDLFFEASCDYVSNIGLRPYPVGFEVQVFPTAVLADVDARTRNPVDHEHVSLYIYTHPEIYRIRHLEADDGMYHPDIEVTLDTAEDYKLISEIYDRLYMRNKDFSAADVIGLLESDPELQRLTRDVKRKYASDAVAERNA